ncbi:MAG: cyclopropane fatty acyl phospholipid synthase [Proteobacteria bacterium]|nr:cyclopropane fatty acyl phospholipid synthase [Pseudomonadota bacterium]
MSSRSQKLIEPIFREAGIRINGSEPWDMIIHDARFFDRFVRDGTMGAGESYMDGWWDCERIDELTARVLSSELSDVFARNWKLRLDHLKKVLLDRQRGRRSMAVAERHYDLGNEFFARMLGPTMAYSCAYWRDADNLDEAQRNKMDLCCRKLELKEGDRLLDVGCGWGSMMKYAAENYGCEVIGITISKQQCEYAERISKDLPVEVRLLNYRDARPGDLGTFDKVVSIGMFEHVGKPNYRSFMQFIDRVLAPDGLFLLHTIGRIADVQDRWIGRYIFPNSYLPELRDLADAIANIFVLEDLQNIGANYDKTMLAWHRNFEQFAKEGLAEENPRFYRMWRYYLLTGAGSFRLRKKRAAVWQLVLSKGGVPLGYAAPR